MASDDSTRRPSSGRWASSLKGPWTPALNAIPIPSTECKGLPPATGVTFTSGNTIRRGHGEQLDPTELSPSPFEVPNWDDFGSVEAMQSHGWEGFQEWLQHAVLPGRAHRWKKNTLMSQPQRWSTTMDPLH